MSESPSPAAQTPQQRSIQETAQSTEAFQSNEKNESGFSGTEPISPAVDDALAEIDRILHQMLLLAEFSSIDANVDRDTLQKVLELLKAQINQIADTIERG